MDKNDASAQAVRQLVEELREEKRQAKEEKRRVKDERRRVKEEKKQLEAGKTCEVNQDNSRQMEFQCFGKGVGVAVAREEDNWWDYSPADMRVLQIAAATGKATDFSEANPVKLTRWKKHPQTGEHTEEGDSYLINFNTMIQRNMRTGLERRIRVVLAEFPERWGKGHLPGGRMYFQDDKKKTTQWADPRDVLQLSFDDIKSVWMYGLGHVALKKRSAEWAERSVALAIHAAELERRSVSEGGGGAAADVISSSDQVMTATGAAAPGFFPPTSDKNPASKEELRQAKEEIRGLTEELRQAKEELRHAKGDGPELADAKNRPASEETVSEFPSGGGGAVADVIISSEPVMTAMGGGTASASSFFPPTSDSASVPPSTNEEAVAKRTEVMTAMR